MINFDGTCVPIGLDPAASYCRHGVREGVLGNGPTERAKRNLEGHRSQVNRSRLLSTTRTRTAGYSQYFCEPSGDTEPSGFR